MFTTSPKQAREGVLSNVSGPAMAKTHDDKRHRTFDDLAVKRMREVTEHFTEANTKPKLSQNDIASLSGIKSGNFSNILNKKKNVTMEVLTRFADATGVNAEWLRLGIGDPMLCDPQRIADLVVAKDSVAPQKHSHLSAPTPHTETEHTAEAASDEPHFVEDEYTQHRPNPELDYASYAVARYADLPYWPALYEYVRRKDPQLPEWTIERAGNARPFLVGQATGETILGLALFIYAMDVPPGVDRPISKKRG